MTTYTNKVSGAAGQIIGKGVSRQLGKLLNVDLNITTDQIIPIINASKYVVRSIVVTNASANLSVSLAAGGLYSAGSKGGTAIVAAAQLYTALTSAAVASNLTIAVGAIARAETSLFFSLTTAHGSAATMDIYLFGDVLE